MTELELALQQLAADVAWPETPDLARAVRARIEAAPSRRSAGRRLAIAFAALVVAVGAVLAVPPARTAILDWFGFGGVEIRRVAELPEVPAEGRLLLGARVSLGQAERLPGPFLLLPGG